MDTPKATVDVEAKIAEIKAHMPNTYASIRAKGQQIGGRAFELVRRGLRGEPDCFYAIEAGRVVGTAFDASHPDIAITALAMVDLGVQCCVTIWPESTNPYHPPLVGTVAASNQEGNSAREKPLVAGFGQSERLIEQKGRSLAVGGVHRG